jgi:hypothetical protein
MKGFKPGMGGRYVQMNHGNFELPKKGLQPPKSSNFREINKKSAQ